MLEALDLSTVELALCALAAIAGAVIQGRSGSATRSVVPTLLIVAPAAVPVTPLVVALPMVVAQAVAERRALDRGVRAAHGGPAAGDRARRLGADRRRPVGDRATAGACCSARSPRAAARRALDLPSAGGRRGLRVGVAGTVGAVGGPYMGLAYADRPGPVMRATISLAFAAAW